MRRSRQACFGLVFSLIASAAVTDPVHAESHEIRFVQTYGLAFLPLHVAIERKLIEKHAAAAGISDVTLTISNLGSGAAINDAIISGSVDVAMAGLTVLIGQMARENPGWGLQADSGRAARPGVLGGEGTIRRILAAAGLGPRRGDGADRERRSGRDPACRCTGTGPSSRRS